MNEFLEQFLIESRELVEQATADLLALEQAPDDAERLDSAFRAFHTLKGAAGIVDFDAMGRALHAAEDVLAAVRAGDRAIGPDLVGACLACLDQVLQWLDVLEASGEPPAGAQTQAAAVVARFAAAAPEGPLIAAPASEPEGRWVEALLVSAGAVGSRASVALLYEPDADCFFRGEDPLALIERLPGLLHVSIAPATPWPELEAVEPFVCNLVIKALGAGTAAEAAAHLRTVAGQVQILALKASGQGELSAPARTILEEQVRMLAGAAPADLTGRLGSAARVAQNVLRHLGRSVDMGPVLAACRAGGSADPMIAALERLVAGGDQDAPAEADEVGAAPAQGPQDAVARALRVDVERIDAIVKLAGELTVVKNAIGHAARLAHDGADPAAVAAVLKDQHFLLERLVGELQQSVLAIRVLPLRHVFQRFPRVVRELSSSLGKPARLLSEGDATEADKAIVESLFEPLLHVLRNALDHGVEPADSRKAAGKPETATIRLRALRQGEHVVVEVEDDGGGVDVGRVRAVAVERGVVSPDAIAGLSDADAVALVFAPGFSTAAEVTGLSGRGVGMDAVRSAIERMGGRVDLDSVWGQGTTVRFTLPFTVMMTRVMTVEAAGQVFGIPFESVVETMRVDRDRIRPIGAGEAFALRDRTVPLVGLAASLGLAPGRRDAEARVVVASAGGLFGALEVDRFGDRLDVMLKPMDGILAGAPGVAGTALLGDGRVLIVLDLWELLR